MKTAKFALATAALAAASAPVAGQAIAADRAAEPVSGESSVGGGPLGILIVFALLGLAIGIVSGDDTPASP